MKRENLKKILLSLCEEDYKSKVDLHIHSNKSDGKMSPKEIVAQAKKRNMKYISIADHNTIDAYLSTNILVEDMVIPAVEFDCYHKGVFIHILAYGMDIDNKEIQELFSSSILGCKFNLYRIFKLRNAHDTIKKIKNAGGISVLAHPACCWCFNIDKFIKSLVDIGLDGLEVYYPYRRIRCILKFHFKNTINQIAEKYALIKTGGSDTHDRKL